MPLESGDFIGDLNPAWPLGSDPKAEGADHLNLIKKVLQLSFGNMPGLLQFPGNDIGLQGELVAGGFVPMIRVNQINEIEIGGQGDAGVRISTPFLVTGTTTLNDTTIETGGLLVLNGNVTLNAGTLSAAAGVLTTLGVGGLSTLNSFTTTNEGLIGGLCTVGLTLDVAGITTLSGTLNANGGANIDGALSILNGNNLAVSGDTTVNAITISGHAAMNSTANVAGLFQVLSGGANITGTLTLTGGANIDGPVSILGGNNLAVTGNISSTGGVLSSTAGAGNPSTSLTLNRSGANASNMISMTNANAAATFSSSFNIFHTDIGEYVFGLNASDRGFVIHSTSAGVTRIIMDNLTAFDPNVVGGLWNNNGVINISAG